MGGGRGSYQNVHGDFPICIRQALGNSASNLNLHSKTTAGSIIIFVYNINSLMSNDRFELLYRELEGTRWDIIVLVETWREVPEEKFVTGRGHLFLWWEHFS